ncbi:MAG: polyprenyl synthetase family protein [Desulfonatronovibrio sp. MSAO_Bac4]|nr:MAG: polyprenyl synthetase family protein [Desulfonatronovibrio sp. MSAO_Bac4]
MSKLKNFLESELPGINLVLHKEMQVLNPLVRQVGEHVLMAGGKRLRPVLTLLTARCFGRTGQDIYPLACSLEFLHSATLIHDDILDNAEVRRGKNAAHLVFGLKRTVLAGDALLALANMIVARYDVPSMNYCVAEAILRTASGEIEEIGNMRNPEMDEHTYLEIVKGKTAFLIQAACTCGAMAAHVDKEAQEHASLFGINLGIAFQLVDDALDYAEDVSLLGKPHGGDLREGKITLPLIFYLKSISKQKRLTLLDKISENSLGEKEIDGIIVDVQRSGMDQKVRQEADKYLQRAAESLSTFPDVPERGLMEEMLELVKTRKF